jgi:hypothetical protein
MPISNRRLYMVFSSPIRKYNNNNNNNNSKCRLCQQFDETIVHIIRACLVLAKEQYIQRHERACVQIHFNICKEIGVKFNNEHWYEYVPKLVEKSDEGKVTMLWNQQAQTYRTMHNHKPDIIMRDKEKGNRCVNRCCNFRRQKCDKERS